MTVGMYEIQAWSANLCDSAREALFQPDIESKVELIESGTLALCEKSNLINRKTIVKLNKNDDIDRRQTMAAMAIAREKNDPLWGKFLFYRMKSKELKSKMKDKYIKEIREN